MFKAPEEHSQGHKDAPQPEPGPGAYSQAGKVLINMTEQGEAWGNPQISALGI